MYNPQQATPLGSPAWEFGMSPKTNVNKPSESNCPTEAAHTVGSEKEVEKGKKRKVADDGVCGIILLLIVVSTTIYYRNSLIKGLKWRT